MPIYEYKCEGCGETFELIQRFSDAPLTVHEGCGGKVERLLSPPAFQFKGSGWYVTDYARNTKSPGARNGKSEATSEAGSKTEAKSESKSETKSESKNGAKSPAAPVNK